MATVLGSTLLASLFVQSVLYGVFIVLFGGSIYVLPKSSKSRTTILLSTVSSIMFSLATINIAAGLMYILDAVLNHHDDTDNLDMFFRETDNVLHTILTTTYILQTLFGDAVMLYRLYYVWMNDRRVFVAVSVCFLANTGIGISVIPITSHTSIPELMCIDTIPALMLCFYMLTLLTNLGCAFLIAFRIWRVSNSKLAGRPILGGETGTSRLTSAAIVVTETGALYATCVLLLIILFLLDSPAQLVMIGSLVQIIGIVFALLNIRFGIGYLTKATSTLSNAEPPVLSAIAPTTPSYPQALRVTSAQVLAQGPPIIPEIDEVYIYTRKSPEVMVVGEDHLDHDLTDRLNHVTDDDVRSHAGDSSTSNQ